MDQQSNEMSAADAQGPQAQIEALLARIARLEEARSTPTASLFDSTSRPTPRDPQLHTSNAVQKATRWPSWGGDSSSYDLHSHKLKVKIEEERHILGSDRNVCLGMLQCLPEDKQPRVEHWFRSGGPKGDYDWEDFLAFINEQFEDKTAKQTAGEKLSRMRMGQAQYFVDYLQDFELKLAQCGGLNWSSSAKILHLETGINEELKRQLVSKSLPSEDYVLRCVES